VSTSTTAYCSIEVSAVLAGLVAAVVALIGDGAVGLLAVLAAKKPAAPVAKLLY
jgi:threonine dehydrogenase-like Zn-dependent dehydrogenase